MACGAPDGSTPVGSVGKPVLGVEVRLGADGELLVRGPNVMRGYWHAPGRTAEVLSDGWYATGDLARIDGGGNIWLSGRARDLIVLPSGLNVWPQDVEDVLRQEAGVTDAAVIAVPRSGGGVSLHAYLIPSSAAARTSELGALVPRCNGWPSTSDSRAHREASLRRLAQIADAGNVVLIFPQGVHVRPSQERALHPAVGFKSGIWHLAAALEASVVPFGVAGTERIIPAFADEFDGVQIAGIPVSVQRGPLAIAFGASLAPSDGEQPSAFAARLQAACYALTRDAEQALSPSHTGPA